VTGRREREREREREERDMGGELQLTVLQWMVVGGEREREMGCRSRSVV
jgi:hypothetical protein